MPLSYIMMASWPHDVAHSLDKQEPLQLILFWRIETVAEKVRPHA